MIWTNTRSQRGRRPSRLPGQPSRLALKDPLSGSKVEAAIGHRDHRLAAHDALLSEMRSASHLPWRAVLGVRVGVVPSLCPGHLAGAVVKPAQSAASSLRTRLPLVLPFYIPTCDEESNSPSPRSPLRWVVRRAWDSPRS